MVFKVLLLPHCQTTACCHSQHYWSQNPDIQFGLWTIPAPSDCKTNAKKKKEIVLIDCSQGSSLSYRTIVSVPLSMYTCRYIPGTKSSGPKVPLQLLLVSLAGLHVKVLEDVVFALGADLSRGHLQWVVVQRDALEVTQVSVAQGYMGNAIAGYIKPNKGQLGNF